jgi:hypothetical protein
MPLSMVSGMLDGPHIFAEGVQDVALVPTRVELALQHRDPVARREDFGVLVPIAARQQPPQHECVRHAEVRESKKHESASSRSGQR